MTTQTAPRDWAAAMPGDVVVDGQGWPWRVLRVMPEDTAAGTVLWLELDGGREWGRRTMRLAEPEQRQRVRLIEGPGWGLPAGSEAALSWARGLVGRVLGATAVREGR